ncbi:MAG: 2OG-Fe(II) oxygenase, partial [Saprospiraceae bacterium]|nr:2OG-Fe(II) oxygenase [Saprospiraceae bacterium]
REILPVGGRLVLFRSELLEHEVLPARRERYSLTGWLRNDDPVLPAK